MIPEYRKEELQIWRMIQMQKSRDYRKAVAKSRRYRMSRLEKLDTQCNCGNHRAVNVIGPDGEVLRKHICPLSWWAGCLNPSSFESEPKRLEWIDNHPSPENDWDIFVDEMVATI